MTDIYSAEGSSAGKPKAVGMMDDLNEHIA